MLKLFVVGTVVGIDVYRLSYNTTCSCGHVSKHFLVLPLALA